MSHMLDESPAASRARVHEPTNGAAAVATRTPSDSDGADAELGAGPRAVLLAIAQWRNPTPETLVVATGYRRTSVQ